MTEAGRQALEPHDEQRVDAENPWPGLASFREQDKEFFRGRGAEAESLERLVLRDRLTVMFGLSGLGKTSLLQAGLFPRLRKQLILPVYIRLDYSEPKPDLRRQVLDAVLHAAGESGIEAPAANAGRTLWEYFHTQDADFWNARNRLVTPLLVFDQFEEMFTLGRTPATRARATRDLVGELADLIEGHPPAEVRARLDAAPERAGKFSYKRHRYKILLSLREDFLPHLEELRDQIPSIIYNRLRLQRMTGDAAMEVVTQVPALISNDVAQRVIRFVAAAEDSNAETTLDEMEIEPAQLCVVCRELNNKRRARREPMITANLLEGSRDEILVDLYERSVADLAPEVRTLIEERLLTASGFRDSVAIENALEIPGVTADHIDKLITRRLLRAEEQGKVRRIELTHDLLTGVIAESRDARRRREATERERAADARRRHQAEERERAARKEAEAKQKLRRFQTISAGLLAGLLLVSIMVWLNYARIKAETQMRKAEALANVLKGEKDCSGGDGDACATLKGFYESWKVEALVARKPLRSSPFYLGLVCKLGNASACAKLGELYESGAAGVDSIRAAELYEQAGELHKRGCDRGDAESCGGLAALYDRGRGVEQNTARAAELYQKACDEDVAESCNNLGVLLQWRRGPPEIETPASDLFQQACDNNSAEGCYHLALLYRWGSGVDKDEERAQEPYKQACNKGNADGCARLARLTGDRELAAERYEKACAAGSALGCRQLGYAYERGRGVEENLVRAVSLYAQSCEKRMPSACFRLGLLHEKGAKSFARAAELYQQACDRGSGSGCYELGVLFEEGRGLMQDEERAAGLYQQACSRGNPQGCELIRIRDETPRPRAMTSSQILAAEQDCLIGALPSCLELAQSYESSNQFSEAERWYAEYATSLYALASFYTRTGQYEKAGSLYPIYEAVQPSIKKAHVDDDDPAYARSVRNWASLYASQTIYGKATPLYKAAIRVQETAIQNSVLSKDDHSYLTSLTSLALLFMNRGKYNKAEDEFTKAIDRQASAIGREHPLYATSLSMLALQYERTGRFASAETPLRDSLRIRETALGVSDLWYASNLIALALLYEKAGWDAKAEPLYRNALAIASTAAGTNSPYFTTSINNLANLYMRTGQLPNAKRLLRRARLLPWLECSDEGPWKECSNDDLLYKATLDQLERVSERNGRVERD